MYVLIDVKSNHSLRHSRFIMYKFKVFLGTQANYSVNVVFIAPLASLKKV